MRGGRSFFGKYRGTVFNNIDPLQQGRLQLMVPDVLGTSPSGWALPCLPVAGAQMGMYAIPPLGAAVWVEFEQGDPSLPIWTGCRWTATTEMPSQALASPPGTPNLVLQSSGQNYVVLSDVPGAAGITLMARGGAMIMINDSGIVITNGQGATITLSGPTVNVNQGALTVT